MPAKKKKKNVNHSAKTKLYQKVLPIDKYPPLIRELIKKNGNSIVAAAKKVGRANAYWLNRMAHEPQAFGEAQQEIVRRALAGEFIPKRVNSAGENKTAIMIVKGPKFEMLYDIAQTMSGNWVFKRKAGPDWIGVLVMPGNDMEGFMALGKAKGAEFYVT